MLIKSHVWRIVDSIFAEILKQPCCCRCRARSLLAPGRSTMRLGRSTGTSGCPHGRRSPSTSTRPSPLPTCPSSRCVSTKPAKMVIRAMCLWFPAHANVHMGAGGIVYSAWVPRRQSERRAWSRPIMPGMPILRVNTCL